MRCGNAIFAPHSFFLQQKTMLMGLTYANIRLVNGDDDSDFQRGKIGEDEVRQFELNVLADTGSLMMVINEDIRQALGLRIIGKRPTQTVSGERLTLPVAGPLIIWYEDRFCTTNAMVLPNEEEPLLGAIPLEEMDLYVHPASNSLMPLHPDGPVMMLK
jgi:hypothetical protein